MASPTRLAIALAIVAVAVLLIWFRPGSRPSGGPTPEPRGAITRSAPMPQAPYGSSDASTTEPPKIDLTNTDPRFTRFTDGTVHLETSITTSRQLHQSRDPSGDLGIVEQLIANYRQVYRENPVGTENSEIIAQLLGKNFKNVVFIAPDLPALNGRGELLDRWGSPYLFHPLKADLMDVRSRGPDRKLWTDDDLSLGLEDAEAELQLNR